jgi:mycofactocin precursor
METEQEVHVEMTDPKDEDPLILEEIAIEEIFVDGICGVY